MKDRFLSLSILVLLSLIPAVLLYLLFGTLNTAGVQWSGSEAVQLGGPVAAFFVTLMALWRMYTRLVGMDNPLESALRPLEGDWNVEAKSETGRQARSDATIEFRDGELHVNGGTFFAVAEDGSKGINMGAWDVDMAVSDGKKLKYFYTLTDKGVIWRGIVEADFQRDSKKPSYRGTWQVIGKDIHRGEIVLTKTKTN